MLLEFQGPCDALSCACVNDVSSLRILVPLHLHSPCHVWIACEIYYPCLGLVLGLGLCSYLLFPVASDGSDFSHLLLALHIHPTLELHPRSLGDVGDRKNDASNCSNTSYRPGVTYGPIDGLVRQIVNTSRLHPA